MFVYDPIFNVTRSHVVVYKSNINNDDNCKIYIDDLMAKNNASTLFSFFSFFTFFCKTEKVTFRYIERASVAANITRLLIEKMRELHNAQNSRKPHIKLDCKRKFTAVGLSWIDELIAEYKIKCFDPVAIYCNNDSFPIVDCQLEFSLVDETINEKQVQPSCLTLALCEKLGFVVSKNNISFAPAIYIVLILTLILYIIFLQFSI